MPWYHRTPSNPCFRSATLIQLATPSPFRREAPLGLGRWLYLWRYWPRHDRLASAACGGCAARWAFGCLRREACPWLHGSAKQEPDGISSLVSLLRGLVFGRQLTEKWPKARGGALRVAVFVAEIQIEAHPLTVVGTLGCRHPRLVQPPLKAGPYLWGHWSHSNASDSYCPPKGGCSGG